MTESEVLDRLTRAIDVAMRDAALPAIVMDAQTRLRERPDLQMTWASIPLTLYRDLPDDVKSAWVFVLREGISTGAERHPNSRQRMVSHAGVGTIQTWDKSGWLSHVLSAGGDGRVSLSIPPNVWHRPVIPAGADWTVLSFHTAPDDELIEERPQDDEHPDSGGSRSELYAGRSHR
jgi:hypothetical protein